MQVPKSCEMWRARMTQHEDTHAVLRNIEEDPCVPADVESKFFRALAATGPWAAADQAWDAAKTVVANAPGEFLCTGAEAGPTRFVRIIRLVPVDKLQSLLGEHDIEAAGAMREMVSIQGKDWPAELTEVQRLLMADSLARPLQVGPPERIVWVSDEAETPCHQKEVRNTVNRLGLTHLQNDAWVVILRYNRREVPATLHVPRCLDGIREPFFAVQDDCDATAGMTQPLPEAGAVASGCPEAVHRGATVRMDKVEIRAIDGHTSRNSDPMGEGAG